MPANTLSVPARMTPRPDSPALAAAWGLTQRPADGVRAWARRQVEKIRAAWGSGRFQYLPFWDNYTEETPEIREAYHRMLAEPMVKAPYSLSVAGVAALDCQVIPADSESPRDKQAAAAMKAVLSMIGRGNKNGRPSGTRLIAYEILSGARINGWSLCELVPGPPARRGPAAGKETWRDIKSKDTRRLAPVIDEFKNVVGVRSFGGPARTWEGPDLDSFVIHAHWPLYCSPTGMSDFRAVFRAAWMKHTATQLRALGLDRYTHPYFKATYGDASQKTAIEEALQDARAEGFIVLPLGATAEAVDLSLKSDDVFHNAIQDLDREMLIGISWSHLPIQEGQTQGGRGDTKIQQATADLKLYDDAASLSGTVKGQMVDPWYERNFADVEPASVVWGAVQEKDLMVEAQVDDVLANKLSMPLSKKQAYERYGRTPPTGPDDELKGAPEPPPGPGGPPGRGGFPPKAPPGGGGGRPFDQADDQFCGGPGSGVPGPCPGPQHDEPTTHPDAHAQAVAAHAARAKARDDRRAAADRADDVVTAADAGAEAAAGDPAASRASFATLAGGLHTHLAAAGAHPDTLAKLDAVATRGAASVGRAADKVEKLKERSDAAAGKAAEAAAALVAAQAAYDAHQAAPSPDPPPDDAPDDVQAAFEKEQERWEARDEKLQAAVEKADERDTAAAEKADAAASALEDARADMDTALGEQQDRLGTLAADAAEDVRNAVDAEEEADPEPEEPEGPEAAGKFSGPFDEFCGGPGSGVPGPCPGPQHDEPAATHQPAATEPDPAANRPSRPEERHTDAVPKVLPFRPPPPKKGKVGGGKVARPTGAHSQTVVGDHAELLAQRLGFRNILPAGQRSNRPGEVAALGSSIDTEYDHSGRAYELKTCNTTSTEYRLKAKAQEKADKLKAAAQNGLTPYVMIGVRDADSNEVHYYAAKEPGLTGAEVNEATFDYVGSVKYTEEEFAAFAAAYAAGKKGK